MELNGNVTVLHKETAPVAFNGNSALEMQRNLTEMKAKIDMVQSFVKDVMVKDLDYGEIPGTDSRSLFQPGADKLNFLYGYARHIVQKDENKNYDTGHYDATVKVQLRHKDSGVIVGEGEGSCSTMESKYRYRWIYESDIPRGVDKSTLVSKTFKARKKQGQEEADRREYTKYRIENADLGDVWNTILKMAIKRAYVGATLAATGLGGVFSQDEEDFEAWTEGEGAPEKPIKLDKIKIGPQASDEKSSFDPSKAAGRAHGVDPNKISEPQHKKIVGDAKRKGIDEDGIKAVVKYVKGKELNDLTKSEASGVIEFLGKTEQEELQELLLECRSTGGK